VGTRHRDSGFRVWNRENFPRADNCYAILIDQVRAAGARRAATKPCGGGGVAARRGRARASCCSAARSSPRSLWRPSTFRVRMTGWYSSGQRPARRAHCRAGYEWEMMEEGKQRLLRFIRISMNFSSRFRTLFRTDGGACAAHATVCTHV
jgi:hypothetical protein